MKLRHNAALAWLLLALLATPSAQSADKPPQEKKLSLKKIGGLENGLIAYVVGSTGPQERRYYVSNVLVTQPVLVTLKADDPDEEIQLRVTKTKWAKSEREASTGKAGRVQVAFRTQGEFGLAVSGAGPGKHYRMTVWVGDEIRRPMQSVVVPRSKWKPGATLGGTVAEAKAGVARAPKPAEAAAASEPAAARSGWGIWLGVGLLGVIAALLAVLVLRKKESGR